MRSEREQMGLRMAIVSLKKVIFHPVGCEPFKGGCSGEMSWRLFVGE